MNALELQNVTKVFSNGTEKLTVLDDISLTVPSGSITVITGESGSGKSTLLNLVGGLDLPTNGSILSLGYPVESMSEEELTEYRSAKLGLVFQFHYLLKDFTALENVMLPAMIAGVSKKEARDKALELIRDVRLLERKDHYPTQLSGGERQRTAVARSLINNPGLILADEPTGNLDEGNSRLVEEILFSLVKEYRKTLALVTHDATVAQAGDLRFHLESGRLVPV
jgi:lipoprotein-releasing system ATP-binding protein